MPRAGRARIAILISTLVLAVGVVVGIVIKLTLEANRDEIVSSLILRNTMSETAYWDLIETEQGELIQVKNGRYRGWYLDTDTALTPKLDGEGLDHPKKMPHTTKVDVDFFSRNLRISGAHFRWKITHTKKGATMQATSMIFAGWYLCVDDSVSPDEIVTIDSDEDIRDWMPADDPRHRRISCRPRTPRRSDRRLSGRHRN